MFYLQEEKPFPFQLILCVGASETHLRDFFFTITYDQRNLPLTMTANAYTFAYGYDNLGNRVVKTGNGNNEYYLRDQTGKELAIYQAGTDNIIMVNLYGNGLIGRCDVTVPGSPVKYYYIKDHLGSIRATINSSGAVVSAPVSARQ